MDAKEARNPRKTRKNKVERVVLNAPPKAPPPAQRAEDNTLHLAATLFSFSRVQCVS